MSGLFKKSFWVPYKDGSIYPSFPKVVEAISEYCAKTKEEFTFISEDRVVIDGKTYKIYVGYESGSRGNYGIKCTQI